MIALHVAAGMRRTLLLPAIAAGLASALNAQAAQKLTTEVAKRTARR